MNLNKVDRNSALANFQNIPQIGYNFGGLEMRKPVKNTGFLENRSNLLVGTYKNCLHAFII